MRTRAIRRISLDRLLSSVKEDRGNRRRRRKNDVDEDDDDDDDEEWLIDDDDHRLTFESRRWKKAAMADFGGS